jgi:hypothetical protein
MAYRVLKNEFIIVVQKNKDTNRNEGSTRINQGRNNGGDRSQFSPGIYIHMRVKGVLSVLICV